MSRLKRLPIAVLLCSALAGSLAAKEVTLELVVVPLPDAIDQFAKASGCQLQAQLHGRWQEKMVDLTFDHTPFWQALDKLCEASELNYQPYRHGAFRLYPGKRYHGPVVYRGPCRFEITGANRSLNYGSPQGPQARLSMSLRIMWEPDWSIMGVDYRARLTAAVKDDGESLLPEQKENPHERRHFNSSIGQCEQYATVQLKTPDQAGGMLKTLEGSVCFAVATREEEGAFEDVLHADGKEIVAGELKVTMGTARVMGKTCVIRLRTETPEPQPGNVYVNRRTRFTLLDADGNQLHAFSTGAHGSRSRLDYTIQYRVKGAKPSKLQFSWPAEHEEQEIPFKFENLPLP